MRNSHLQTYHFKIVWAAVVVKGAQVVAKAPGWSLATTESLAGRSSWRDEDAKRTRL